MPAIETIAKPRGNRISVPVPEEYSSYSFQVILVPIRPEELLSVANRACRTQSAIPG